jgi:predicted metal-dependent hydrolase
MTDMQLQVRKVMIDFTDAKIYWNPTGPEFSHVFNAFSSLAPELEPFLINVMREAKTRVPATETALLADIALFSAQEARHYRMHANFNRVLYAAGHELAEAETKLRADYERFLAKKGPKFCLAYSEGFETLGPALSGFFFDRSPHLMEQWHEPTTFLWLWHVAEEYEHRAVVNSTYRLLYNDHWYRLYGFWYAIIHIFVYVLKNSNRMIKYDLATGRIQGRFRSRYRQVRSLLGVVRYAAPRLAKAHRRSYDPAKMPPMDGAMLILARASEKYGVVD